MVEIDGKIYDKSKVLKALKLYEDFLSGQLAKDIKEALENEF